MPYKCYDGISVHELDTYWSSKHVENSAFFYIPDAPGVCMGLRYPYDHSIEIAATREGATLIRSILDFCGAWFMDKETLNVMVMETLMDDVRSIDRIVEWVKLSLENLHFTGISTEGSDKECVVMAGGKMIGACSLYGNEAGISRTVANIFVEVDNDKAGRIHKDLVLNKAGLNDLGSRLTPLMLENEFKATFEQIYGDTLSRGAMPNLEEWVDKVNEISADRDWIENSNIDFIMLPD